MLERVAAPTYNSWRRSKLEDRTINSRTLKIDNPVPSEVQILLKNLGRQFISPDSLYLAVDATLHDLIDSGWSEDKAEEWCNLIMHHFKQSRPSYIENFMG